MDQQHASSPLPATQKITPMLRQYLAAKQEAQDALLFFRMGDFYELFFEDAKIAARELGITLTAREKGEGAIPMAGIPHHAAAGYWHKLLGKGFCVAVCDQIEDPKQAKGLVQRAITQIMTPGTLADMEALDPSNFAYLGAVIPVAGPSQCYILGLLDMLLGECYCTMVAETALLDELERMHVRELLWLAAEPPPPALHVGMQQLGLFRLFAPPSPQEAQAQLLQTFGSSCLQKVYFSKIHPQETELVCASLLLYASRQQKRHLPHLQPPKSYERQAFVLVDSATRRHLELVGCGIEQKRQGSLLHHLDRTKTPGGARLLRQWLLFPLRVKSAIEQRQQIIAYFQQQRQLRQNIQQALLPMRDMQRILGRVAIDRATPRDLLALASCLQAAHDVQLILQQNTSPLQGIWRHVDTNDSLRLTLQQAISPQASTQIQDGHVFLAGYDKTLDQWLRLCEHSDGAIEQAEQEERQATGIHSLKIRHHRVFGLSIEITKANLQSVPKHYERRQTLVSSERFSTPALRQLEEEMLAAKTKRLAREWELFQELLKMVGQHHLALRRLALMCAELDVYVSLAEVAEEGAYTVPTIQESPCIIIQQGRHPVLERLMPRGEVFVPNEVALHPQQRQLLLITGPNMAGKSTVMRQTALLCLMAHMGSPIPASQATIGLFDRIFTRIGAADHLTMGQSTFMVEMLETAHILQEATPASLVLFDEIGRGTSTFDGMAIAWAVMEELHEAIGCLGMFSTHYHELCALAERYERIINVSVSAMIEQERIVFLRKLEEGPANQSYGIAVAQLAGLSANLLRRATALQMEWEQQRHEEHSSAHLASKKIGEAEHGLEEQPISNPSLLPSDRLIQENWHQLRRCLHQIDIEQTTPLQALQMLQSLQQQICQPELELPIN